LEATIEVAEQSKVLHFETTEPMITIGRESKNDFQLPLTTVSRQHCRISVAEDQYFVEDLGSSHGTQLNGQKLNAGEKKLLRNGDVLSITKAKIKVEIVKQQLESSPGDSTQMLARNAVEKILGGLGGSQEEVPYLRIMTGPDEGRTFKLQGPVAECVLGRSRESDLVINDGNASRRHGLIKKDYSGVIYQCLGAKNLATINGKEVPRNSVKRLRDRDEIAIGAVKIVFIDPDAELLKSLSGIPGFEDQEPEQEVVPPDAAPEEEPSQVEQAPTEDGTEQQMGDESVSQGPPPDEGSVAEEAPAEEAPAEEAPAEEAPAEEQVEEQAAEVPAETPKPEVTQGGRFGPEMIFVVIAGVVVVLGVVVLILLI
jgi:pSer/pThr/pTyr-binding forkhead associated (FHA) protein